MWEKALCNPSRDPKCQTWLDGSNSSSSLEIHLASSFGLWSASIEKPSYDVQTVGPGLSRRSALADIPEGICHGHGYFGDNNLRDSKAALPKYCGDDGAFGLLCQQAVLGGRRNGSTIMLLLRAKQRHLPSSVKVQRATGCPSGRTAKLPGNLRMQRNTRRPQHFLQSWVTVVSFRLDAECSFSGIFCCSYSPCTSQLPPHQVSPIPVNHLNNLMSLFVMPIA